MVKMDVQGTEVHQAVVDFLENWERMERQECQDLWALWGSRASQV